MLISWNACKMVWTKYNISLVCYHVARKCIYSLKWIIQIFQDLFELDVCFVLINVLLKDRYNYDRRLKSKVMLVDFIIDVFSFNFMYFMRIIIIVETPQ